MGTDEGTGSLASTTHYVVHVEGDDITVRDVMVAADIYRLRLEDHIGGSPLRVVQCFEAWSKELREGAELLDAAEAGLARAWCEAHEKADRSARPLLSSPATQSFDFRPRNRAS